MGGKGFPFYRKDVNPAHLALYFNHRIHKYAVCKVQGEMARNEGHLF